jgi:fructose-bisphosphate aldolase class II
MPLVPMRQILEEAAKADYGVGSFNVNNMEQVQAIMNAAAEVESAVIIQISRGALKYAQEEYLVAIIRAGSGLHPKIPVALHLDHGNSLATCKRAIELGFTSVMMDGSLSEDGKEVASYEYNVEVTKSVSDLAHQTGVTVEGELGALGGIEDGHGAGLTEEEAKQHLTDPVQAGEFVELTGVDALAVAIGTSHGAYKFKKEAKLAMDVIKDIHKSMPDCHMVMHGSSSVPPALVEVINEYGGDMQQTFGVPLEQIKLGIENGVRKINVDTDSRLAMTGAVRKVLYENSKEFDPRKYFGPSRDAMEAVVKDRLLSFGSANHAYDYTPMSIDDMKSEYGS